MTTTQTPEGVMPECPACGNLLTNVNDQSVYCDFCELECKLGEQMPDKTEIIRNLAHKVQYLKRKLNEDEETIPKPAYIEPYLIRRTCGNCANFNGENEHHETTCDYDTQRVNLSGYCASHIYTAYWENLKRLTMED